MDHDTLLELGEYLNENISLETCDNSLKNTIMWLENRGREDIETDLAWIGEKGVTCDCDLVIKLYIPARESTASTTP